MIAATEERELMARIERLERVASILIAHLRERETVTNPAASYPGTTAERAIRQLDEAAVILKPIGEPS